MATHLLNLIPDFATLSKINETRGFRSGSFKVSPERTYETSESLARIIVAVLRQLACDLQNPSRIGPAWM